MSPEKRRDLGHQHQPRWRHPITRFRVTGSSKVNPPQPLKPLHPSLARAPQDHYVWAQGSHDLLTSFLKRANDPGLKNLEIHSCYPESPNSCWRLTLGVTFGRSSPKPSREFDLPGPRGSSMHTADQRERRHSHMLQSIQVAPFRVCPFPTMRFLDLVLPPRPKDSLLCCP